jgi:hypothetical protein
VASQITYSHLGPVSKRNFSTASESRSMTRIRPSRSATMTMIADGSSRWSSLEQFADEIRRLGLTAALLTNGTDTIPAEVAAPGLESHFDAIFNSADIAFVKPDIRAFDHVLDALAVLGPDVFFTDDSAAKLLGASVPVAVEECPERSPLWNAGAIGRWGPRSRVPLQDATARYDFAHGLGCGNRFGLPGPVGCPTERRHSHHALQLASSRSLA